MAAQIMDDLNVAARNGDIDLLYRLIAQNPTILAQIDEIPLVNTPFHAAAEAGCTHFAIEIMSLMPSFARKLNPDGLSPLDLALREGRDELVKRLIEIDSELIRVKGKERWTPLHYVAKMDNVDLLADFLFACPLSINDVTIRKENALHIAAANGKIRALGVLIGWLKRTDNQHLLRWKDEKGNTLLHVVASNCQLYGAGLPDILVTLKRGIDPAERNSGGLKALDIISQFQLPQQQNEAAKRVLRSWYPDIPISLDSFSEYLSSERNDIEIQVQNYFRTQRMITSEIRNSILVVVTLIVTATYQAVFQPPSRLNGDHSKNSSNTTGTFIDSHVFIIPFRNLTNKDILSVFYLLHSLVFAICLSIIIFVIQLNLITWLVHLCLFCLYANYFILIANQDVYGYVKIFTFFLFNLCYFVFCLKVLTNPKDIHNINYPLKLFLHKHLQYIVKIQLQMSSSKYHGLVGTRN